MDFHFYSWKSHGKSMMKKRGHPVFVMQPTMSNEANFGHVPHEFRKM